MEKTRTRFGSILKSLMEEKGITAVTLSKMIRVHRTDVPHYISGTRQPADQEKIQQICEVMMLSPEDTHTLLDAWKVDRIGIDLYERRMYVHRFLSNLNEVLQRPEIFDLSASSEEAGIPAAFPNYEDTDTEQKIPALRRLFGVSELTEAMMLLLLEETRGEKSEVLLLAQPDLDFPMNLFSTIITRNPDCSIRHILCLENSKRNRNGLVNLEYLNRMLPSLSSVNYQPVYCYYSINDVFSSMNILPCVLVTEKRVLLFSKNCKEGLLVSDNTITEFYREKFRELFAKCIPMAEKVPDPRGILDFYRPHLDNLHDCPAFDIAEQPCFLRFLDMDMITRRLHKELRESPFYPALEEYLSALNDPAIQLTCYFIKDGVERFLETGRVDEVPEIFYDPFSKQERHDILKRLYQYYSNKNCEIRMLRTGYGSITKNISMFSTEGLTTIECPLKNRSTKIFAFTEKSITDTIFDYLKSLEDESALYSKEETMEYLKALLK